jgi:transcriptional regulator with XRE-family HTH domain
MRHPSDRIRAFREGKRLSQGDIQQRTGLLRPYLSRVENGHTITAIETLETLAHAVEVPLYYLFYEGEGPPKLPNLPKRVMAAETVWGRSKKEVRFWNKLLRFLPRMKETNRELLLHMAQKMGRR